MTNGLYSELIQLDNNTKFPKSPGKVTLEKVSSPNSSDIYLIRYTFFYGI